jgi:hypothetical protein
MERKGASHYNLLPDLDISCCYRIWKDKKRGGAYGVGREFDNPRARTLTHLLDGGVVDGGERGGLGRVRRVAECLGILETGHVGAIAREYAVVLPGLLGSRGNLTVALNQAAGVEGGAHGRAHPGRELGPLVEVSHRNPVKHAIVAGEAVNPRSVVLEAVLVDPGVRALVPQFERPTATAKGWGNWGQDRVALAAEAVVELGIVQLLEGAGSGHGLVNRGGTGLLHL